MRRLCLFAAAALSLLPAPVVRAEDQPVTIAPFEVLESYPGCSGPGKIAFRVSFETEAKARFSISGRELPGVCTVKTRKGAEVIEQQIECPDSQHARDDEPLLDALPRKAIVSADTVVCLGLGSSGVLASTWRMTALTESGPVSIGGDLDSEGLTIFFNGLGFTTRPEIQSESNFYMGTPKVELPLLRFVFDGMPVSGLIADDMKLSLTAYLVVAPEPPKLLYCRGEVCKERPLQAKLLMYGMGGIRTTRIVEFVEEP